MLTKLQRIVVGALMLACGPVEAGAITGVGGGGGSGAAGDPTPTFQFAPHTNTASGSGVANLTADAFALTPVVVCDARTMTATNWPCGTGGTFVEDNGDVTPGFAAPFTDAAARSGDYDRFYSHQAPSTALGEVDANTTFSALVVAYVTDRGATQYLLSKYDTVNSQGWGIRISSGGVVQGIVNGTAFGSVVVDTTGWWGMLELTCSSTNCRLSVDGVAAGSTARSGTLATVTSPKNLTVGCRANSTNADCIDGKVAYVRVSTGGSSAVVDGDITSVNLRHAMELEGTWPTHAVVAAPTLRERTTPKMCEIIRDADGQLVAVQFLSRVGPNWMCVGRFREADADGYSMPDGRVESAYFAEPPATNLFLRSHDFGNAAWTDLTGADYVTALGVEGGPTEVAEQYSRYVGALDIVGVEHGVRQSVTLATGLYVQSVYAGWTPYDPYTSRYVWLRDNTIGATATAWFDVKTCQVATVGSGVKSMGNNINRGVLTNTRVTNVGDWNTANAGYYHWCRLEVVYDVTAGAHDLDFGFSETDGSTLMTSGADDRIGMLLGAQVELMDRAGDRATSYIPTLGTTASRGEDRLRFGYQNIPAAGGMLLVSLLLPDSRISNSVLDYATARVPSTTPCWIERDASNSIGFEQTGEADTTHYGVAWTIVTAGVQQWTYPTEAFATGRHSWRNGRMHSLRATFFPGESKLYPDGETVPNKSHTGVTLPDLSGASALTGGSGISIGYTESFNDEWARGGVHECTVYDREWEAPAP